MGMPSILLVTKSQKVSQTFERNLRTFFDSRIDVFTLSQWQEMNENLQDKIGLILLSTRKLLDSLPDVLADIPVLIARRNIEMTRLPQLMEVSTGTKCLLVANDMITAEDSVEFLRRLGFQHLDFVPYGPEIEMSVTELKKIDLAITHGWPEFVPDHFNRVIDLHNRPIDLTTIFDIAQLFNLSIEKAHYYTADFFRDFVQLGRNLAISVNNEKQLKTKLESILNAVHEGIIGIDKHGYITFFNEDAGKILHLRTEHCINKRFQEIIPDFQVEAVFESREEISDQLLEMRNLYLLVTKIPLMLDGQFLGVVVTFQDVTKVQRIEQEIRKKSTHLGLTAKYQFDNIIGMSQAITSTKEVAVKVSTSDYTVLITGENGTGKEIFAQAIHQNSSRKDMPFVPVNFAGLTESLAESELFGYEEGSFTGAKKGGKIGLFELAHNGTIFLDEIGDAPLSIQAALLRVLQERQVMRVGGNRVIPINVRVIAATNRNLMEMVQKGMFREDLYYRLNVLPLRIPALNERREDILILIEHFLQKKNTNLILSSEVKNSLLEYNWPGNIRELENFVNYLTVIVEGEVELQHIPERIKNGQVGQTQSSVETELAFPQEDGGEIEQILFLLMRNGSLSDYEDILANLLLCSKRQQRIGRGVLNSMLAKPLTEARIRNRLAILNRSGCISVGQKKQQGTQITLLGIQVLQRIKNLNVIEQAFQNRI
ncbi:sigma 54-interacting transcriptional regulator [Brevibacillus sp. HB1.3]|uniref:sigma-54 interaction domain-containing protein n=1 Tax=Brevibacillus sp. HB1.3 TaxID=2738842 RepID=UPI0015556C35|nr:sigma 54-interacting transcriptional regulator [Brevibacillus sp. HB1.3]NQF14724.1 sigma 54-interacting transcriptional regulator [Brevibacillus sp. HB1.3]